MKLNNNGFGLRDMIIYTSVLLLFLLFAVYSIDSLHKTIEEDHLEYNEKHQELIEKAKEENKKEEETEKKTVDYNYYSNLEDLFKRATMNYINDYNFDLTVDIEKVSSDTLIGLGYISGFKDQFGNETCTGYSNVYQDENFEYVIKSYISCSNYMTEGY